MYTTSYFEKSSLSPCIIPSTKSNENILCPHSVRHFHTSQPVVSLTLRLTAYSEKVCLYSGNCGNLWLHGLKLNEGILIPLAGRNDFKFTLVQSQLWQLVQVVKASYIQIYSYSSSIAPPLTQEKECGLYLG